jgi:hypothetical protein
MGVFATRDLPKGTEFPILGDVTGECSRTHSWEKYDRSRPKDHQTTCIDGHPSNDPHKGVANYGLSISMMLNEANNPNCTFRQSNYVQLVRNVKKGQELTVFYGDGREMQKIRREQGYSISYEKTADWPKESGTPAQRVANFQFWMGFIVQRKMKKNITKDIIESKVLVESKVLDSGMPRLKRSGARNTYHCKHKNKGCNNTSGALYINEQLGVNELHCLECMKKKFGTMKGAKALSVGEYGKLLGEPTYEESKPEPKPKKTKKPKPQPKPVEPEPDFQRLLQLTPSPPNIIRSDSDTSHVSATPPRLNRFDSGSSMGSLRYSPSPSLFSQLSDDAPIILLPLKPKASLRTVMDKLFS